MVIALPNCVSKPTIDSRLIHGSRRSSMLKDMRISLPCPEEINNDGLDLDPGMTIGRILFSMV